MQAAVPRIHDRAELETALDSELYLLFKHSLLCPISRWAFDEYEAFVKEHPEVATGWIDVRGQRDWSDWVAERTGVVHQSPQALLILDGKVIWDASHDAIKREALHEALAL